MAKGYYLSVDGGENFEAEALLATADYTDSNGKIATKFVSVKDSNDNIFTYCGENDGFPKIIKIDNLGNKTVAQITNTFGAKMTDLFSMKLSRDETRLYYNDVPPNLSQNDLNYIPTNFTNASVITPVLFVTQSGMFAIYQDRYIWTASGTTISVYDYTTKALIDSEAINGTFPVPLAMCCDISNNLYVACKASSGTASIIQKFVLNGSTIVQSSVTGQIDIADTKQMLIDRWGDLVILTSTGTASRLLKYTTAGELKDDVNLSVIGILGVGKVAYSLNVYSTRNQDGTLKDCQVSFENDLGLWLSEPVTRQGELFGTFTKVLNTANVTYGNCNGGDNNYSVRC